MMVSNWQIVETARAKGKIAAIKLVRKSDGLSLMQAKEIVEAALDGVEIPTPVGRDCVRFSSVPFANRRRKTPLAIVLAIVVLLLATIGCLSACFAIADSNRRFCEGGEKVTGKVTHLVSTGRCKAPAIRYEFDGESHLYESNVGSNPPMYNIGETVFVVVDPVNPSQVMIDDISHRWAVPIVFGLFGLATGFAATVVTILMRVI